MGRQQGGVKVEAARQQGRKESEVQQGINSGWGSARH
jgi:hypothetical protein